MVDILIVKWHFVLFFGASMAWEGKAVMGYGIHMFVAKESGWLMMRSIGRRS